MNGSVWPTGARRSPSRTCSRGISAAAAAAHDSGFVELSGFPGQSPAAPAAPPSAPSGPAPAPATALRDVQNDTDQSSRTLRTMTPHRDPLVRRLLSAGIRRGAPHTDLAGAVPSGPGPRVARPHRVVDGSPSSSSLSSSPPAGDSVPLCGAADNRIARAVAAMADNRMDDYHNFLRWLAAVEARDRAFKYHMGAVVTSHHARDDCGGSVPTPFHPGTAWFRSRDGQDLSANEEGEPDSVLGRSLFSPIFPSLSLTLSVSLSLPPPPPPPPLPPPPLFPSHLPSLALAPTPLLLPATCFVPFPFEA